MIHDIKLQIDRHEIISFDIFDTLLFRNLPHPQDIFFLIEKKYNISKFRKNRIVAEMIAREKTKYNEVTIKDIYDNLDHSLIKYELAEERKSLFANPELIEIYKYAKSVDKKIVSISDMYLEKSFIKDVLEKNGFYIEDIFVSSSYLHTKEQGKLYDIVIDSLSVDKPDTILHIGDNLYSDVKMAKAKGLNAIHYQPSYIIENISTCLYKKAIMQRSIESLKLAQSIKLGRYKDKVDHNTNNFFCNLSWNIFKIKDNYTRCTIRGIVPCIKKILKKVFK